MGIARGTAKAVGGEHGRTMKLSAGERGDLSCPAINAPRPARLFFLWAPTRRQEPTTNAFRGSPTMRAMARVRKVPRARKDPGFGLEGPFSIIGKTVDQLDLFARQT
jgi:hypothetical protein